MRHRETTWDDNVSHMDQTTNVQLDTGAYDAPMSLKHAVALLRSRGVEVSRASLYRWNDALVADGARPLIHQPSGNRGRVYVVPAEVESHIRNRCSDVLAAS